MSRTVKGSKGCGYDYWSKRPCSGNGHGKQVKKFTHRAERGIKKRMTQDTMKELLDEGIGNETNLTIKAGITKQTL